MRGLFILLKSIFRLLKIYLHKDSLSLNCGSFLFCQCLFLAINFTKTFLVEQGPFYLQLKNWREFYIFETFLNKKLVFWCDLRQKDATDVKFNRNPLNLEL